MDLEVAFEELWRAAVITNDFVELAEASALRDYARASVTIARRMAGRNDRMCADGIRRPGHGAAA